jgi:alkylhydroperoxidase family enzyme
MAARLDPAEPPYEADVQAALDGVMRGSPPLLLFKVLARDPRLFRKFFSGGLLDRGHLTLREREVMICRTTALCGSEYEWGVHIAAFGERAGFSVGQVRSLARGRCPDVGWSDREMLLLRLCETLHARCTVDDCLWQALREHFSEEAVLEMLMLAGFYRTVSYLTNALDLPMEPGASRFPAEDLGGSSFDLR